MIDTRRNNQTMCVESMTGIGKAARLGTAGWLFLVLSRILSLAATPTFALMAWLPGIFDSGSGMHDLAAHSAGRLIDGMTLMYLLMSVFHATPWLRLLAIRRSRKQEG